jgi:uncharacterized protein
LPGFRRIDERHWVPAFAGTTAGTEARALKLSSRRRPGPKSIAAAAAPFVAHPEPRHHPPAQPIDRRILMTNASSTTKIVVFYDMAADALAKVGTHFAAHRARLDEFQARGTLLAAGPLGNPPDGAMAIFTTREAAEEFVQGDAFVTNGLVGHWRLVEWRAAFL